MLLATKYEAGVHLDEEENDFMPDNAYGDNTLEELNAAVIMMTRIQPTDDESDAKPTYDDEFISEVNASQIDMINGLLSKSDYEQRHHEKLETIIHTSVDDQNYSDIIFDDPFVDNNSGHAEHDTNAHDQSLHDFETLLNNVQVKAEKQRKMNVELKNKNKYLEDIVSLEAKLRSHDQIVYKMSHSLQIIHMLGKKPNKVYDPHLKTGLGFENLERLKKAVEAQPKMYDGEKLESTRLKVDLPDYEETLEDAEKSRLKMKDKMIPLDYAKLNALYESFVPQTKILVEQTYFSSPSTSNVSSESSSEKSDLPSKKMPNESKLLKLFVNLDKEIKALGKHININLQKDRDKIVFYDDQVEIRRLFTQKVVPISDSLKE
ncbi:hypothetical protein Tco_1085335 [Tanacetum coccineum]